MIVQGWSSRAKVDRADDVMAGISHSFAERFKARQSSFVAISSLGKFPWP
jgi:hypothetical protein